MARRHQEHGTNTFYDQISRSSEADGTPLLDGIAYNQRAGPFDLTPHVNDGADEERNLLTDLIPLPLWAEFRLGDDQQFLGHRPPISRSPCNRCRTAWSFHEFKAGGAGSVRSDRVCHC